MVDMTTPERTVEEVFEGYNYASFTWNGDNATGVNCAKKSLRVLKQRVAKALKAERKKREEAYNAGIERAVDEREREYIKELEDVIAEKNVTDEWRVAEVEAIISLRKRNLTPPETNHLPDRPLNSERD